MAAPTAKEDRKPKVKGRRMIDVWAPEDFLSRTSWYRFGPHSPKRQAHEIIKILLAEVEALKCAAPAKAPGKSWAQKVKRKG